MAHLELHGGVVESLATPQLVEWSDKGVSREAKETSLSSRGTRIMSSWDGTRCVVTTWWPEWRTDLDGVVVATDELLFADEANGDVPTAADDLRGALR